ncbi:MAG: 16S rRNA (guanine(966)-N(2))-methyltransferase RsmD [Atopobiaceae bacterium]|nr:16S rRNA (guanine(966)-N(2))-methyltransferase RsmD [Atopobiaceae bacterium]
MRIVGGKWRGRNIQPPKGYALTRPTAERTREAIASSILAAFGLNLENVSVLDAFAGSGAMGLELLSRGAAHVTFVDQDRKTAARIQKNAQSLGARAQEVDVLCHNTLRLAERKVLPGAPFDIVFLDPPYAFEGEQIHALLDSLIAVGALAPNALIVYEHGATTLGIAQESMVSVKSKRYGIACVDFMRLRVDHPKSLGEKSVAAEDKIRNQAEGEICGED